MFNKNSGWVLRGNEVLRTVNMGRTWKDVSPYSDEIKGKYGNINISANFLDESTAWISYSILPAKQNTLTLYHTNDGGTRWKKIVLSLSKLWENSGQQYISFVNKDIGFMLLNSDPACGQMEKALYKTSNGGNKWTRLATITNEIKDYTSGMKFISKKIGWITSTYHSVNYIPTFKTTDGGQTWKKEKLKVLSDYHKGYYQDSYPPVFLGRDHNTGILPQLYVSQNNKFTIPYISSHNGSCWSAIKPINNSKFTIYSFITINSWFAINTQRDTLYKTTSMGSNWQKVSKSNTFKSITSLSFISKKIGFAVGDGTLLRTTDGGKIWRSIN